MKNIFRFLCMAAVVFFASCDEDFFETTVPIDLPEHTPLLSVSGNLSSEKAIAKFHVSDSKSLNDSEPLKTIENADFKLFKNGGLLAAPVFNFRTGLYEINLSSDDLEPGSEYRLEVNHPDFESVSASQIMPSPVKVDKVIFEQEGTIDEFGDTADEYTIDFTDDGNAENYYMVRAIFESEFFDGIDTIKSSNEADLSSLDPNVNYGFTERLNNDEYETAPMFSDAAFSGKKYQLKLNSYPMFSQFNVKKLTVYLLSLTRERYLFLLSLNRYYESEDNPFAEPVTVTDNVENGLGNFGAQAVDSLVIRF